MPVRTVQLGSRPLCRTRRIGKGGPPPPMLIGAIPSALEASAVLGGGCARPVVAPSGVRGARLALG
eukprot:174102-Alexandrium_andersonii.AAC.1